MSRGGLGSSPARAAGLLETRATRLLAGLPDPGDDGLFRLGVGRLGTSSSRLFPEADFAVEGLDRVLAIPA